MITHNKTKLQFLLSTALFLSVTAISCNNGENKETVKDEPATEIKTTPPPAPATVDSVDSMEKTKGNVSPVEVTKPK